MDNQPLHPNLARLAAAYDDILRRFSIRQLDAPSARAEILALQARDDEGVVWTIDPDSGEWKRRTRTGTWVVAVPPRSGLATLTAHDLSRDPRLFNPDSRVRFAEEQVAVSGLHGSVKGRVGGPRPAQTKRTGRTRLVVAAAVAAVALAAGAATQLAGDDARDACAGCEDAGTSRR